MQLYIGYVHKRLLIFEIYTCEVLSENDNTYMVSNLPPSLTPFSNNDQIPKKYIEKQICVDETDGYFITYSFDGLLVDKWVNKLYKKKLEEAQAVVDELKCTPVKHINIGE